MCYFFYIKIISLFSMEKDKTREYENKQIFVESSVSKETCLFSCIWSNCCRYTFFTIEDQLKHIIIIKRWTHSSYEDDDIKRYMKRRLKLSSDKLARHQSRIKLHAIFINVKIDPHRGGRSSCNCIFSKYTNLIEDIMSRSNTDMIVMIVIIQIKKLNTVHSKTSI